MTVNYHNIVSNSNWSSMLLLLCRWRGSIVKAVVKELFVWLSLYYVIYFISRFVLSTEQMRFRFLSTQCFRSFENLSRHCEERMHYIPLCLILGFFVKGVVARYDEIIVYFGSIDNVGFLVATHIHGTTERARLFRRTIIRYCVLGQLLSFRNISSQVKKRFPTLDTVVASGFIMDREKDIMLRLKKGRSMYWLPFLWAMRLLNKAFEEGHIRTEIAQKALATEVKNFRQKVYTLRRQNRVPIPLAYPQLVYFAVNAYFLNDFVIPWMGIIEFVIYYSWMTVAMHLLNPFGEDDDDFEINWLIDKNLEVRLPFSINYLQVGMKIVDKGYGSVPSVTRDLFFGGDVEAFYSTEVQQRCTTEQSLPDAK